MKKITYLAIILIILLTPMVFSLSSTTASLKVTSLRYEPYPVEQGSYFKMWIKLENQGVKTGDSVTFELLPKYPFSLDPNQDVLEEIGRLDVGREVVLEYKIRVAEDAVSGENELKGRYCIDEGICVTTTFNIDVKPRDAILSVAEVSTIPNEIAPGDHVSVKIKLNNIAESLMENIRVKLDLYEKLETATSISYNELPFTPLGSTNEIAIEKLSKGESKEITFDLIADADAEIGVYKVPIVLTYSDSTGTNYTRNYITALILNDEADLYAIVDESTVCKGSSGLVDVRFINKGLTDIKFLDIELKESDDYEIKSSNRIYIGNLDSDDYETAEYRISVGSRKDSVDLLLNLNYRDAINNPYQEEIVVPLSLDNESCNGQTGSRTGLIIFIIVVVGVGIFFYIRWRRCKRKK
jgi:hypothetical protein